MQAECTTNEDCEDDDLCTTNVCSPEGECEDPVAVDCPDGQECDAATGDCIDIDEGGDAAAGETTYASDCMGCHGDPANPPGPAGPGIAGATAEEIEPKLNGDEFHVGGEFPELGDEDYLNLEAYLATF